MTPANCIHDAEVNALALGSSLYVGGNFTAIGGTERWSLAAVDPQTGAVRTGFDAGLSTFNGGRRGGFQDGDEFEFQQPVHALAVSGSRLYAGGEFDHVFGGAQQNAPRHDGIVALNTQSGALDTTFDAKPAMSRRSRSRTASSSSAGRSRG